jgi:predicted secreted protein
MMRMAFLLACAMAVSTVCADDTPLRYNQVRLQAQQSEAVSNDTMHVTLNSYAEMQNSARLAARINQDMEWALARAKPYRDVKVSTGGYQTWPVVHKDVTTAWRGQQDLMLESRDTETLSKLTGELQEKLKVRSMSFSVSDEQRIAVENRLIDAALNAFKQRARIVGDNLNAKGYRIVDINVGTSAQRPPVMYQARVATMAMEASDAVAVEGGESDVQVTVSGTIELQIP